VCATESFTLPEQCVTIELRPRFAAGTLGVRLVVAWSAYGPDGDCVEGEERWWVDKLVGGEQLALPFP
jgi:hypothetical protein